MTTTTPTRPLSAPRCSAPSIPTGCRPGWPPPPPATLPPYPASPIRLIVAAYADTLHVVFLWGVPVAGLAFVISLFLKEVPLRESARADTSDMGGGFGMPDSDSMQQLERSLGRLLQREGRDQLPALRAASG